MTVVPIRPWKADKEWSDAFMPQVKRILGAELISEASPVEDALHNTDLMIGDRQLVLAAIRVGVRIRKPSYLDRFSHQFTIRAERTKTGNQTELAKIIRGYGDYFFYGIASPDADELACWALIDLGEFRLWFNQELFAHRTPFDGPIANGDGGSTFYAFNLDDLPPAAVKNRLVYQTLDQYDLAGMAL